MRDTTTEQVITRQLMHSDGEASEFYRQLPEPSAVLCEATGHLAWFRRLLSEVGHQLIVGDAAKLRAMRVRKQKTDKRDARHLLEVFERGDFPVIWLPTVEQLDLRQLLIHRHRLVQMRTRVMNQLQAMAMSQGLCLGSKLWSAKGQAEFAALPLDAWAERRRRELQELRAQLEKPIRELSQAVEAEAQANPDACRLMTHPGVGPITALAFVLTLGTAERFDTRGQVASYLGLIPGEWSSGNSQRFGPISKQGNRFLRCLLVEAGQSVAKRDPDLARRYTRWSFKIGRPKAKVAVARRLAIRLWIMWRKQLTYSDYTRTARMQVSPAHPVV